MHGNVGQEALYHIVSNDTRIDDVSNPLSASGGVEPESIEDVRQKISRAFLTQERGVTPDDYKEIAERHPQVSKANAVLRWTGSWYTVFLVMERVGGMPVDDAFKREIRQYMESFRMAGGDLLAVRERVARTLPRLAAAIPRAGNLFLARGTDPGHRAAFAH